MRSVVSGLSRIRVLNLREIRTHRLRVVTSLLVVVVASALLISVLGLYGSLTESVRQVNAAISGSAQVEVAAIADSGVDDDLAAEIRRAVPEAKSVVPLVRNSVVIDDRNVALLGSDFRVTALSGDLREAAAQQQSGGVDEGDLADGIVAGSGTGLTEGERLTINDVDVQVISVIDGDAADALNRGNFIFAYLGLAQRLAAQEGKVDSILIVAEPGTDIAALKESVASVVDGRAVVVDPDFRAEQVETASSVTRDATLLVSLISLVIAGFLVFNTMNMAVASRRQSLAMMRALGARRSHLVGDLLGESALFGLVGGALGVPIGILAGRWAIGRIPEANTDQMATAVSYHLPVYAPVIAIGACVLACVAATTLAARSVFAVSPVEAMVAGEVADGTGKNGRSVWIAGIVGVVLLVASWFVATGVPGRPAILAGAVFAVGALLLCYALTVPLVELVVGLSRRLRGPGQLAAVNTERAPRRAWATLMTVAVAVAVGMGTSGALDNLVSSISGSLDGLADPDFYVSTDSSGLPIGPALPDELAGAVAQVPGVTQVVGSQWASINVDEAKIYVQGLEPNSLAPFVKKADPEALQQVIAGDGMLMSTILARTLDVAEGDTLQMATPSGYRNIVIRDLVNYISMGSGTAAMSNAVLSEWFDRPGATYLQVSTDPAADPDEIRRELEAVTAEYPTSLGKPADVESGAESLENAQAQAEQAGAFTVAIQWIVALAAAVALLNTLLLSVIERRRELGVLRAMGASRRFVSRMVVAEAAGVALIGSLTGLILGGALHFLSDKILWATTSIDIQYSPRPTTLIFVAVACGLCIVGALIPAMRASRMNISESILNE
ncbi:FtsX-like permease family protein [Gordonia sp. HNM0687]|uniref:FtsX-like permease family protein n=1 Tax=Gordonia mangrovi TaxID=2665643 RepID=A0A6L7GJF5_9ACTN|nr:FtsX-like permease family protein [Gordonia mangrovi]MXP20090.1 FtsX-like permease family protein [Gordonia mangrovi]UVF79299.1 FtsX-like permease family protein [Gordonia mangrovi]